MSLNWDLRDVKDWKTFDPTERDAMIWATMAVGIGQITENNAERFFNRLSVWEKMHGAMRYRSVKRGGKHHGEPVYFTLEDVRRYVGLKTNVSDETPAEFSKHLIHLLKGGW